MLFEQSEHAGVWPYLSKATILAEMRSHINQAYSPFVSQQFSGPAAIAIALIHQDPCRYVRLCHSLYETGGFQIPYCLVQASETLRHSNLHLSRHTWLAQVDWMLFMTLYENEGYLFHPSPLTSILAVPKFIQRIKHFTKPWEMCGWMKELLGYGNIVYRHNYWWLGNYLQHSVVRTIRSGGTAMALIQTPHSKGGTDRPDAMTKEHARSKVVKAQGVSIPQKCLQWVVLNRALAMPSSLADEALFYQNTWNPLLTQNQVLLTSFAFRRSVLAVVLGKP